MVRHGALLVKPILGQLWAMNAEPLFFRLRLTEELKAQIEASAKANGRSMNAEVLARLERSFELDDDTITLRAHMQAMDEVLGMHERSLDRLRSDVSRLLEHAGLYDPNPEK